MIICMAVNMNKKMFQASICSSINKLCSD